MATSTFGSSLFLISCCASCMTPESSGIRKNDDGIYSSRSFVLSRKGNPLMLQYQPEKCVKNLARQNERIEKHTLTKKKWFPSSKMINEKSRLLISTCLPGKTNIQITNISPTPTPYLKNNWGSRRGKLLKQGVGSVACVVVPGRYGSNSGYASMKESPLTWKTGRWGGELK